MSTPIETLTCKQVAEILHTSADGLAQMRYRGIGPKFVKLGPKKVIYTMTDVQKYIEANTVQRTDDPRGAA